eukprot:362740-Chlamydomonas_euryale.AAC.6
MVERKQRQAGWKQQVAWGAPTGLELPQWMKQPRAHEQPLFVAVEWLVRVLTKEGRWAAPYRGRGMVGF